VDVDVRVVDKGAGLDIPGGGDMKIAFAPCDAAISILTVVPEVHGKQRLGSPDFMDAFVHKSSLLRCNQKVSPGAFSYRDIGKIPGIAAATLNHIVNKFIGNHILGIIAVIAG